MILRASFKRGVVPVSRLIESGVLSVDRDGRMQQSRMTVNFMQAHHISKSTKVYDIANSANNQRNLQALYFREGVVEVPDRITIDALLAVSITVTH